MFNDVWMNDKFTHIKVNDNFKITTLQQMVNGNILTKNKQNNSINGIIVIGNKKGFYKVQEIKSYFMELQGYYQMYSKFPIPVWGDRIFEKCGIRRDEEGDGGKTLEIRGKRRLSARDGGANYQQS